MNSTGLLLAIAVGVCCAGSAAAQELRVLEPTRHHLRSGTNAEWAEFAASHPEGKRSDLRFAAAPNPTAATLFIQQDDVRHDWSVELNGRRLGKLFLMEADLIHTLRVPAGSLRASNVLSIIPPARENDDIVIRNIALDSRPIEQALGDATFSTSVRDEEGKSIPARITLVTTSGALAPLLPATNGPAMAARPGVVYTGNAEARFTVPAGEYIIYASRGFEWSVATQRVHVAKGETAAVNLRLRREVDTRGWVSCDTHIHTLELSKHGDATLKERMLTLAGEGIELTMATEHNLHADYAPTAKEMGLSRWFTAVAGNEVTSPVGHFNIFPTHPTAQVPDARLTDWPELMKSMRATPDVRTVVLNHPRNVHNGFQPFAATNFDNITGENKRGPEFSFDAMEVLNSSAQQSDYMLVYRDWFALLNYGYRTTAVGSSDSHDVSRYIVGQGRTYVQANDSDVGAINVEQACKSLNAAKALVSMGLLVNMTVDGRYEVGDLAKKEATKELTVTLEIQAPSWITATNLSLYANGRKIREQQLANVHRQTLTWQVPRPPHDIHLVAIATGPGVTAPFWAIPRPYQPTSPEWSGRVIGSTNPIWVDGDGDGRFTAARAYAKRLVSTYGSEEAAAIARERFDQAVLLQVLSLPRTVGR